MPINETAEERELTNELKLLIKQANQRLLRIERLTGVKEGYASKQLLDYLSASPLNAVTKGGRISFKEDYTFMQKYAIKKAIEDFKKQDTSGLRGVKKFREYASNVLGKKVSYKQADVFYKATQQRGWLWDNGIDPSEYKRIFEPKVQTMDKESWIDMMAGHMADIPDRQTVTNLEMLYDYLKKG